MHESESHYMHACPNCGVVYDNAERAMKCCKEGDENWEKNEEEKTAAEKQQN